MNISLRLDRRLLENFSWPLLFSMLALCACGLLNLYSISSSATFINEWSWFVRQGVYLGPALVGFFLILTFDYQYLKRVVWPVYGFSILCLIAVLMVGLKINGATRWLDLGLFRFQPSESVKVVVVVALAAWFAKRDISNGLSFKDLVIPSLIVFVPFMLIHNQPDLGTAVHLVATCLPMFLVFRFRPVVLLTGGLTLVLGAVLMASLLVSGSWKILQEKGVIKDHQIQRIEAFIDPAKDRTGIGWQPLQSQNAVGGGMMFGWGFMEGPQHNNGFLPEAETDFAFAVLAEEWGFVGCMVVLALYFGMLSSSLVLARRSKDRFGSLIVLGLTSLLFWQLVINVGMVTGLLPVVGIPLPFISYGGTSLVATLVAVALILNVGMRRYLFQEEPIQHNPFVWRQTSEETVRTVVTVPVRRLAADTPFNPELHPRNKLPHSRPWAKYLRRGRSSMSGWQAPDPFESLDD